MCIGPNGLALTFSLNALKDTTHEDVINDWKL